MSLINKLFLNSKHQNNNEEEQAVPKKIHSARKRNNQSLETVFRFPKSLLKKIRLEEAYTLKKERSFNLKIEPNIQLGDIGTIYHNNLMKNRVNLFKETSILKKNKSSFEQCYMADDKRKKQSVYNYQVLSSTQYNHRVFETLNLIQRNLIQDSQNIKYGDSPFEVQASRLPMIRKRSDKRKQLISQYGQKYYPTPHSSRQDIQFHTIVLGPPAKRNKEQKPDIRGWDTPDFD